MLIIPAAFLACFIVFRYLSIRFRGRNYNFFLLTKGLPKPFSCETCLTFWLVLTISLFITTPLISLLLGEIAFISYIALAKLL